MRIELSSKPLIDATVIDHRLDTMAKECIVWCDAIQTAGLTMIVVNETSMPLAKRFQRKMVELSICVELIQVSNPIDAAWCIENEGKWLGACVIYQDVVTTGETLQGLYSVCSQFLTSPVLTMGMFMKCGNTTEVFKPHKIGFSIPNDFIVGCGLGLHGLEQESELGSLPEIHVLAS